MKRDKKILIFPLIFAVSCLSVALVGIFMNDTKGFAAGKPIQAYYIEGSEESTCVYSENTAVPGRSGVTATLTGNDMLMMRRVLDVREITADKPLITVYPLSAKVGRADYTTIYIDVVDAYDENNYFTVSVKAYPYHENDYNNSYSLAYANNGQVPTGLDRDGVTLNTSKWGTWTWLSFASNLMPKEDNYISVCYDEVKNAVYVRDLNNSNYLVNDFDDLTFNGKNVWGGFKTGEVYCRVHLDDYISTQGSFLITQYGNEDLLSETFVNVIPPELEIDTGDYDENNFPMATVGKPYSVFPAHAIDLYYGNLPVDTKVYTNYYSSNRNEVVVKKGAFIPRIPVDHYIVYTVQGSVEEKTSVVLRIRLDKNYVEPTLEFIDFPDKMTLGEKTALPRYVAKDGSGNIDVSLKVTNGTLTLSTDDGTVRPIKSAPVVFTYTLTDYLGTEVVIQKTALVQNATKPTFGDIPIIPDILIENVEYTIPTVNAYNYITAEGTPAEVETSVIYNGKTTVVNGSFIPVVDNNKDPITIRYTARVGNAVSTYEKVVSVYKVKTSGKLDMTKYFETKGNASLVATKQSINISGTETTDFSFINYVGANNFKTNFITGEATGLNRFDIILSDIVDQDNVLKFTYKKSGNSIIFFINDNEKQFISLSSSFSEKSVMGLILDLYNGVAFCDVNTNTSAAIKTNLAGMPFTGFTAGRAKLSYHLEGAYYTIGLQTINNQFLSNDTADYIGPYLDFISDYGGERTKGDVFVIPEVLATDVLTGEASVYITVQRPDDSYVYDNVLISSAVDAVSLNDFGHYYVEISAKDGNGRTSVFSYVINVTDNEAPVFGEIAVINDSTVGKKVVIPRPTATDNIDGNVEVQVYIGYPGGQYQLLGNYDGIIARAEGKYTVVYIAEDSFGNRTTAVLMFMIK